MPYINTVPNETAREWAERRVRETGQPYFLTDGGKAFFDCEVNRDTAQLYFCEKIVEVIQPNKDQGNG